MLLSMPTPLLSPHFWRLLHTFLSGGVLLVWLAGIGLLATSFRRYQGLVEFRFSPSEAATLPTLSVLVAACNEAAGLERAMRSLLALHYPCLEIIAIDDRSEDATGAILDRLAASDPRLRVRHIAHLPPGWLGKTHALQIAGQEATGDWLLFTDADVVFERETLLRAVAYAHRRGVDHLVVSPRCETHGFWEKLFVSYFGLMYSFRIRPWHVANPQKEAYVGFGAFNLVRANAYRALGEHRALRMEVVDDMKLGKLIKRHGFRQEIVNGTDLLSVRWVVGWQGVLDSLHKNAFAAFDFKLAPMLASCIVLALTACYPIVALLLPLWPARGFGVAALLAMIVGASGMRRVSGANAGYGLAYPLACLLFLFIILRSTWSTVRQNGVRWRGTLYPLDELRKGVV